MIGIPDELGLDTMIYKEPENEAWKESWKVTEGIIELMHREVAKKNAEFLVVMITNSSQVHPDVSVRTDLMKRLSIHNLLYPNRRIEKLGTQSGFRVLNLVPFFQKHVAEHGTFLHGFPNTTMGRGHWNEEGHRLAGQLISDELCQIGN